MLKDTLKPFSAGKKDLEKKITHFLFHVLNVLFLGRNTISKKETILLCKI